MDTKQTIRQSAVARRQASDFTEQLIEPFTRLRSEVDGLFESFPFRLRTLKLVRFASAPSLEMTETTRGTKSPRSSPASIRKRGGDFR